MDVDFVVSKSSLAIYLADALFVKSTLLGFYLPHPFNYYRFSDYQ